MCPTVVVAYKITLSVGKMYETKHSYKVDQNQEVIALGACNLWASFFSCIPSSASIPRSSVQESGGGKTQV
jgi:solute carrier family 26 protein